jgi:hypothetical protein
MSAIVDNGLADKAEAERLIATVPLIPEVQRIDVELYTDNTGDPAFQLLFRVRADVVVDKDFIKKFNDFAGIVQTKILHSDLHRFPYSRLKQEA